jgi:hypothetical protein
VARLGGDALELQLALPAAIRVVGQEEHAGGIASGSRKLDAEAAAFLPQKLVWNLKEDAGAVAGLGVAAGGATVREVPQDLDALFDDLA